MQDEPRLPDVRRHHDRVTPLAGTQPREQLGAKETAPQGRQRAHGALARSPAERENMQARVLHRLEETQLRRPGSQLGPEKLRIQDGLDKTDMGEGWRTHALPPFLSERYS